MKTSKFSKLFNYLSILAIILGSSTSLRGDEVADTSGLLKREIQLIKSLEAWVEKPDLGRLFILKGASQAVIDSIGTNGLGHKTTFQEFQRLIVTFRFSVAFFKEIETDSTRKAIAEILNINDTIAQKYGFDDSPYTQITISVFAQMEKLMTQLADLPMDSALKIKILNLRVPIGETLAASKAKGGDRRTVYPIAEKAYRAVLALYPDFNKIAPSDRAFNITLEIQGLNEFYGEFAEFNPK